jgi:hypothetical protein
MAKSGVLQLILRGYESPMIHCSHKISWALAYQVSSGYSFVNSAGFFAGNPPSEPSIADELKHSLRCHAKIFHLKFDF